MRLHWNLLSHSLVAGRLRPRSQQHHVPSAGTRERSIPRLSLSFCYFLDLWLHNSNYGDHSIFPVCWSMSKCPLLLRTPSFSKMTSYEWIIPAKSCFQFKSHSEVLVVRILIYEFWGDAIPPLTVGRGTWTCLVLAPNPRPGAPESLSRALFIIASCHIPDAQTIQGISSRRSWALMEAPFASLGVTTIQPLY